MTDSPPAVRRSGRSTAHVSYREMDDEEVQNGVDSADDNAASASASSQLHHAPRGHKRSSTASAADEYGGGDEDKENLVNSVSVSQPSRKRSKQSQPQRPLLKARRAAANGVPPPTDDGEEEVGVVVKGEGYVLTDADRFDESEEAPRAYTTEELLDTGDIPDLQATDADAAAVEEVVAVTGGSGRDKEPDSGIVTRVVLKNFMVHQHFTIELNPHVTFIHGPNGSQCTARLSVPLHPSLSGRPLTALFLCWLSLSQAARAQCWLRCRRCSVRVRRTPTARRRWLS